jgi:hypothetical protein
MTAAIQDLIAAESYSSTMPRRLALALVVVK